MNYIQNGATRLTPRQARQLVTNEFAEVTQFHRAEFNVMPDVA